jgi:hypothetical protein
MDSATWLGLIEGAVHAALPHVDVSRSDDDLLTLSLGTRSAVVHVVDDVAILAPSFAAGGTIGSRLQDHVQHLEMTSYALTPDAASAAASIAVGHLRSRATFDRHSLHVGRRTW